MSTERLSQETNPPTMPLSCAESLTAPEVAVIVAAPDPVEVANP
jgi:hypothetical protein